MNSRDAVLGRIRQALASGRAEGGPAVTSGRAEGGPPEAPEVWPRKNPTADQMAQRFAEELEGVSGEVHRVPSMAAARGKLAELFEEAGWTSIGGIDRPLCRELASELGADQMTWVGSEGTAKNMSELPAGLIDADYLLADTGTCMVTCGEPEERLMCYLPPVSIVIATTDRLREHMPAVWEEVARRTAAPETRGEFVFITGPSRTADIEKILILGAHGPKRLVVLLVG